MTAAVETGRLTASVVSGVGDAHGLLLAGPSPDEGWEDLAAHRDRWGPFPRLDDGELPDLVETSGLCGRGGGQFPLARKLRVIRDQPAHRRAQAAVVVNLSESEPASRKDHTLATLRPHLVLDGAALAARDLGAGEVVLHLHGGSGRGVDGADDAVATLRAAVAERRTQPDDPKWRLSVGPARYVAGEASAVLSFLEGGPALPRWSPAPAAVAGLSGRPTLVSNAETFAQVAAVAALGAEQWRDLGPGPWSGPLLLTLAGAVDRPGEVVEVVGPATVGHVLAVAGGLREPPAAVLVGGYAGTWVPGPLAWRLPLDRTGLTTADASIGCGLLAVLPADACGLTETARLVGWLAGEGAGQCGPCAFGLPRLGDSFRALAGGAGRMVPELHRLAAAVDGRGACRHPDGVVRLVRSALRTFGDDVRRHRWGRTCAHAARTPVLPLPEGER